MSDYAFAVSAYVFAVSDYVSAVCVCVYRRTVPGVYVNVSIKVQSCFNV